jgi:hypothetical protein
MSAFVNSTDGNGSGTREERSGSEIREDRSGEIREDRISGQIRDDGLVRSHRLQDAFQSDSSD